MVPPNGDSRLARSTSTWIHWWSPVASANWSTSAWVISSQPLTLSSSPTCARSSSIVVMTCMSTLSRPVCGFAALMVCERRPHHRQKPCLRVAQRTEEGPNIFDEEVWRFHGGKVPADCEFREMLDRPGGIHQAPREGLGTKHRESGW